MRTLILAASLLLPVYLPAADKDFNGRWDITVTQNARKRAWWLEVKDAGTSGISGMFVGAPGGQLDKIPEIALKGGELQFKFPQRRFYKDPSDPKRVQNGLYTARLVNGKLEGKFQVDGKDPISWSGVRAPRFKAENEAALKPQKPIELFNGKDLSGWRPLLDDKEIGWTVENGVLKNAAGTTDIVTQQKFWNFKLHAEYRVGPKSNSGIGLRGRYEVQIFEDIGQPASLHGNGALYSRIQPTENASKPANEWQAFDITLVGNVVTVVLNGKTIIDHKEIEGLTAIAVDPNESEPGPFIIQGDHGAVEFRKLTLTPLK
ncbi:MAG TPA: DUF1080 domain-containing protein [Bryobacteraceae bacterium]|nr:DUF1080 domain-containing protein [Bryobacteraceae bacterium]